MVRARSTPELRPDGRLSGLFNFLTPIFGLFGQRESNRSAERMARLQAEASREAALISAQAAQSAAEMQSKAAIRAAELQSATAEKAALFSFAAAREGSRSQERSVEAGYQAQLMAQGKVQRASLDQATADLLSSYQRDVFGLAATSITETGSTLRVYPRWGVAAAIALVGIGAYAIMGSGGKRSKKSDVGSFRSDRSWNRRTTSGAAPSAEEATKTVAAAVTA